MAAAAGIDLERLFQHGVDAALAADADPTRPAPATAPATALPLVPLGGL